MKKSIINEESEEGNESDNGEVDKRPEPEEKKL